MSTISGTLADFFKRYKPIRYGAGEVIIQMSGEPSGVYYVESGFVKMNTILINGNELTLNIFKPGTFFPMFWAIADTENNYLFEAVDRVELYRCSKTELIAFLKDNPDVLYDLTRRLLLGFDGLLVSLPGLVFGSSVGRVASALMLCARRFGKGEGKDNSLVLDIILTHQDIANIAGLSRETTSVVLGKLKHAGLISQGRGRVVIRDLDRLGSLSLAEI